MPLTTRHPGRWSWRALLPWGVGVLPLLCGGLVVHWQVQADLHASSQATAAQLVNQVDHMLDALAAAARTVLPLAGKPCRDIELILRQQVIRNAFVRSANLVYQDRLYCSSLLGATDEPVDPASYADGRLWLMAGNDVTPGHALLVYRAREQARGALVALDGQHLQIVLGLLGGKAQLAVQVAGQWIDEQGRVHAGQPPQAPLAPVRVASSRYPFSVDAGFAAGMATERLFDHYPSVLVLLTVLGVLAGAACRWQLRHAASPRAELQRAMRAGEFVPYLQPVVRNGDYAWAGAEVLMRWQHPREGLVRPDLFIPYAEHTGQILPMTRQLMQRTAEALAPHAALLGEGFHVSINISADHCRDLTLLEDCRSFLAHFPPGRIRLILELTERKLLEPSPLLLELFDRLHGMGVSIALDDFGTGHSSLAYLRRFQVDYLKIDQGFVGMIGGDALSVPLLDTIIELSSKLGLRIIAEGVESELQRDYLAEHGVDFQQGYLFARPMPVQAWLHRLNSTTSDKVAPRHVP